MSHLVLLLLLPLSATCLREFESGDLAKYSKCGYLSGVYTSVMRNVYNTGFHKDLTTSVEVMLTTSLLPDKCRLLIEETFPRGLYADTDQLRDLYELKGLKTYTSTFVDLEKPEFESESFRLYVFRDLRIQENLRLTAVHLPIHLRYHKPRSQTESEKRRGDQPVAIVKMQNPRLLLTCDGEDVARHCPDRTVTTFCDASGTTKCEYLHLPYKVNVNAIEVSVPVGNSEHTPFVVGATTLAICGGTIYLMGAIFRKSEA